MRPLTSSFLDLLRISAATGVVVSHIASSRFGWSVPILESLGHACVAVFFVLSGYVIAWITDTREVQPRSYIVARLSRLYSVLIPALVVTAALDSVSMRLDPTFFESIVGSAGSGLDHYLRAVLFLNQAYGTDYAPGSNSPVWSLGYEAPYYAAFAVLVFARGLWKIAGLILLAALVGPAVLMLFPVWLMGVALYRLIGRQPPNLKTTFAAGGLLVCLTFVASMLAHWQTKLYTFEALHDDLVETGHSNQLIIFYVIGLMVCCLITLVDFAGCLIRERFAHARAVIAYVAGSTFSIYLFHYPVLVALYASTHYDRESTASVMLVFATTIATCVALSFVSERQKRIWRRPFNILLGTRAMGKAEPITQVRQSYTGDGVPDR